MGDTINTIPTTDPRYRRQLFKVQVDLIHLREVLIYSRDRYCPIQLEGISAHRIIHTYSLSRTKPKTYVYGRLNSTTRELELEPPPEGEIPQTHWPNW